MNPKQSWDGKDHCPPLIWSPPVFFFCIYHPQKFKIKIEIEKKKKKKKGETCRLTHAATCISFGKC